VLEALPPTWSTPPPHAAGSLHDPRMGAEHDQTAPAIVPQRRRECTCGRHRDALQRPATLASAGASRCGADARYVEGPENDGLEPPARRAPRLQGVSLNSMDDRRITCASALPPPEARETIHLRMTFSRVASVVPGLSYGDKWGKLRQEVASTYDPRGHDTRSLWASLAELSASHWTFCPSISRRTTPVAKQMSGGW
jgi:hypothetical protein